MLGKVHETAEITSIEGGVELAGTRLILSTAGGLLPVELRGFRAPASVGDWVEVFLSRVPTVDTPYPVFLHNKATGMMAEIEYGIWKCAASGGGSTEDWAIALLKREARYFAYEHSGVVA
ncbi:hypothetical protein [Mesorhizobium sp. SARCC-RB16n]|uniref:hypothetical protein n=1 Tax=Mesorhizobium sp. SARCC-RB16n TaxID=2116687 RepID=UPI00122EE30F|nr:hypothetical protein [Mesorhizobium sp. SARCC-RB16n]